MSRFVVEPNSLIVKKYRGRLITPKYLISPWINFELACATYFCETGSLRTPRIVYERKIRSLIHHLISTLLILRHSLQLLLISRDNISRVDVKNVYSSTAFYWITSFRNLTLQLTAEPTSRTCFPRFRRWKFDSWLRSWSLDGIT